jgi:hypothetical protein
MADNCGWVDADYQGLISPCPCTHLLGGINCPWLQRLCKKALVSAEFHYCLVYIQAEKGIQCDTIEGIRDFNKAF